MRSYTYCFVEKRVGKGWEFCFDNDEAPASECISALTANPGEDRIFALICNYRNTRGITPLAEGRGMPDDLSVGAAEMLKEHGYESEFFAHWFFPEEIISFEYLHLIEGNLEFDLKRLIEKYGSGNVRIVFWFD